MGARRRNISKVTVSRAWREFFSFGSWERHTRPDNGSDREETGKDGTGSERAGPGPGGGGAGWARARGPATQVSLSPPGPCPPARGDWHPKGERDRESAPANPKRGLDSTGRRHLVCKGEGQEGRRGDGLWPIGEGQWQKCRKTIGLFERRPEDIVSNKRGGKNMCKAPPL